MLEALKAFEGKSVREVEEMIAALPASARSELDRLLAADDVPWRPLPGPQTLAATSKADIVGYGGAAGGGKSDLMVGLAVTEHTKAFIVREEGTQLTGIIDRLTELVGSRTGYNGQDKIWRLPRTGPFRVRHAGHNTRKFRQVEFGSVPNPGDETRYQGRPKDFLGIDEATNLREEAVRFLMGWVRTTDPQQRTRVVMTFNPPTDAKGRWVIDYFAPWLDKNHPIPAMPGELRWFATINGRDIEVIDGRTFVMKGGRVFYDYDYRDYTPDEIIQPQSRTFIPSRIADNPYLVGTGYMATLQALPEPLRSQMLLGDFTAGMEDDQWQVIPTAWVEAAQARWRKPAKLAPMDSMGVDVARGGKDNNVIARRHGMWFDEPITKPRNEAADGPAVAGWVINHIRDKAPIHLDIVGVGASPYDFLRNLKQQVIGVSAAESATSMDKSGRLSFANFRTQMWWKMREALDPSANTGIALPPGRPLLVELTTPHWEISGRTINVWSREKIIKEIGHSADLATAYVQALIDTPKEDDLMTGIAQNQSVMEHDPYRYLRE